MTQAGDSMTVAVLMGGVGAERAVSLDSGRAVVAALAGADLTVRGHDLTPEDLAILDDPTIAVFFPALHGRFGEDGQVQRLLAERGRCFVGSDAAACARSFDKLETKRVVADAGLRTPEAVAIEPGRVRERAETIRDWGRWVVKPVREGSSVGVSLCADLDETLARAEATAREYGDGMIERFVAGREVTVGVLGDAVLPVIEIRTETAFYDYHAKYETEQTQYCFETLAPDLAAGLQADTRRGFAALGLRDVGRLDFLVDAQDRAWFLEANAMPGLTSHSLLPKAAARAGWSMTQVCETLVRMAAGRRSAAGTH